MRLIALAFLVAGCNGCNASLIGGSPPPLPTTTAPLPAPVDSGDSCASDCAAAQTGCAHPAMTADECTKACKVAARNLDNPPKCIAQTLTCSVTTSCPKN